MTKIERMKRRWERSQAGANAVVATSAGAMPVKGSHLLVAAAIAAFALTPSDAMAQAANQTQVDSMLNSIVNLLTGPIAKTLAIIAFVVAGYMFFFGNGNKMLLGSIIVGCFIVFGAGWLVDTISGGV
jgi:type IV secretion system protein VirB2